MSDKGLTWSDQPSIPQENSDIPVATRANPKPTSASVASLQIFF